MLPVSTTSWHDHGVMEFAIGISPTAFMILTQGLNRQDAFKYNIFLKQSDRYCDGL